MTDRQGNPVEGLTVEDFLVSEDGQSQQVESFARGDNANIPRTIVLIIDYSGSQFPFIKTSIQAAKTLIDKLNPNDRMAIVTDDVELIADFTRDKEKLKKKLDSLEKKATTKPGFFSLSSRFGQSKQYSALLATLNEAFDAEDQRPIVIFQTDGDELVFLKNTPIPFNPPPPPANTPPQNQAAAQRAYQQMLSDYEKQKKDYSLRDIQNAAEKVRTTIYTVIPGFKVLGVSSAEQIERMKAYQRLRISALATKPEQRKILEERLEAADPQVFVKQATAFTAMQTALLGVSETTGGWADFLETPEQVTAIYSRILSDINRRYIIGYYPTNDEPDGKRRKVSVTVRNHPEYIVWGRKSYVAAGR